MPIPNTSKACKKQRRQTDRINYYANLGDCVHKPVTKISSTKDQVVKFVVFNKSVTSSVTSQVKISEAQILR